MISTIPTHRRLHRAHSNNIIFPNNNGCIHHLRQPRHRHLEKATQNRHLQRYVPPACSHPISHNIQNHPLHPQLLTLNPAAPSKSHSSSPLSTFLSARTTFHATYSKRYDQAGLLFTLTDPSSNPPQRKWIKTGIELYQGTPRLSTVSCDSWADWSVGPAPHAEKVAVGEVSITILVRKEGDENGGSWWVYCVEGDEEIPLREICWVADPKLANWQVDVAALVARPAKEDDAVLDATFDEFVVKWE